MTASAGAPSAAAEPAPLHRDGLSRPETIFEKIGFEGSKWLGRLGLAFVVLALIFAVLVGVPAWSISGSPSYLEARRFIYNNDEVRMEVGGEVIGFDKVPNYYRVSSDRAEFRFGVQGEIVKGFANVTVKQPGGIWSVTSASFMTDTRKKGVHKPVVLLQGKD